ncbi:MAG: hypothetical protein ACFB10_08820 [Salibacteraceae bacterium]
MATFTYPEELIFLSGRLESEGIESRVLDELTVQTNPLYSGAVGGVKLQVRESDLSRTREVLTLAGYTEPSETTLPGFWIKFDQWTQKIPLLNRWIIELRLVVLLVVALCVLAIPIAMLSLPTAYEQLTDNNWCLDFITYQGQDYVPRTLGITLSGPAFCEASISFQTDGTVRFPGFNSYGARGKRVLNNDLLQVAQLDTFQHIFEGTYSIEINYDMLVFRSATTSIHCHQNQGFTLAIPGY